MSMTMLVRQKGSEIIQFLKSFEGAAAACPDEDGPWSLWVPEISAGDRPVTPASQIYFPVILRHGSQLIAIRFFYDCGSGKIRFYTGAIPARLADLPEFENAVSELFRHSLPVEPIRQRKLRRVPASAIRVRVDRPDPEIDGDSAGADPELEEGNVPAEAPTSATSPAENATPELNLTIESLALSESSRSEPIDPEPQLVISSSRADSQPLEAKSLATQHRPLVASESPAPFDSVCREERMFRFEICDQTRRFLQLVVVVCGLLGFATLLAFVYLQISEDPGVRHHRMQLEQQRIEAGR